MKVKTAKSIVDYNEKVLLSDKTCYVIDAWSVDMLLKMTYICSMKHLSLIQKTLSFVPVGVSTASILVVIALLTLMPSNDLPSISIPYLDKVVHLIMFGALSVAALFDSSRYFGHYSVRQLIICALFSSLVGGGIELLQQAMGLGRGAELADFVSDTIGSFLMPLLLLPLIKTIVDATALKLQLLPKGALMPKKLLNLYFDAFPEEERRPLNSLVELLKTSETPFRYTVIRFGIRKVGFITWWKLDGCVYVEHFAIHQKARSHGLGAKALALFCQMNDDSTIVLEVEPEGSTEMASRRINFYKRSGFVPHPDFEYVQPPYTEDLPSVPLMLMTWGATADLAKAASQIHRNVYGVKK